MDKLSELLKDFYKHFAGLGVYIIPGVIVLETVFDIGFFGHRISTAYDLTFYILWGLILGLPFHFIQPKQLNEIFQNFKKKKTIDDDSFWKSLSDELELGFIYIKVFAFYLLYKFIIWQNIIKLKPYFNLNCNIANYIIATVATFVFGMILIFPYKWFLEWRFKTKK